MKREIAMFMATVMLFTTPAHIVLASEDDVIMVEDDSEQISDLAFEDETNTDNENFIDDSAVTSGDNDVVLEIDMQSESERSELYEGDEDISDDSLFTEIGTVEASGDYDNNIYETESEDEETEEDSIFIRLYRIREAQLALERRKRRFV